MPYYDSASIYISSCKNAKAKITAIDAIIDALLLVALTAAGDDNIEEYELHDGQTKIRTKYKGAAEVMNAVKSFETLKNYYINQVNGRRVTLVDQSNFPRT